MRRLALAALAFATLGLVRAETPPPRPRTDPPPSRRPAAKPTPKATPAPAPILEGIVKGPDGKPIAGARVFYTDGAAAGFGLALVARTDDEGRFSARLKSAALLRVQVEAKGLALRSFEKVRPGAPLLVTLERGRAIEGRVRDTTGHAVPQARLLARAQASLAPAVWDLEANRVETITDARGRYRLEGLGPGFYVVAVRAPEGAARKDQVRPGSTVDFVLQPKASVSAVVLDPARRPVGGALVRAEPEPPLGGSSDVGTTDAQGRVELFGLEAGTHGVIAHHPDFAPAVSTGLALETGGHAEATLVLTRGVSVTGRVLGPEERPLPARAVVQEMSGQPAPRSLSELLRAEAGADGRFRIERVPPGAFVVGVMAQGFAGRRVEVAVAGRDVDAGDVVLETGLAIRGRLRSRGGDAVADAALRAFQQQASRGGSPSHTRSEADGSFVLAGLSPGPYRVQVTAPGFAPIRKDVLAGSDDVDLVLEPGGAVTGVVVEEGDRPVASYRVLASPARPERLYEGQAQKDVASSDGRFLLEDLVEGDYVLQVFVPERAPTSVPARGVVAGRTTDVGVVRVRRGGVVRGTVVDTSGEPIVAATVRLLGPGEDAAMWMQTLTAETDPSGAFEIRGAPEGPQQLVASHAEYAPADARVDVDSARGPAEARLVMGQGGRIDGSARKRDGTPLTGLRVTALSTGSGRLSWDRLPQATVGADGRFAIDHIPPGSTRVSLMSSGGPGRPISTSILSKTVEAREGETVVVDFLSREILVTGHVTRAGTPLPGLTIRFMGESMSFMGSGLSLGVAASPTGPQHLRGTTDEEGSFALIVDEPGRYHARIESPDTGRHYPTRPLEIPDVEAHDVEITFSGVPVDGFVVDGETEKPVARATVQLSPKGSAPSPPGGAMTGADGRFSLEADPGEYRIWAGADDYRQARSEVTVDPAGTSDLRLELERGLDVRGRVLDRRGRAVSGIGVIAMSEDHDAAYGQTLPDGTFRIGGLAATTYNLCAGAELAGYAVRAGVRPSDSDLSLTLRPGGTVRLLVMGTSGAPVPKAHAHVSRIDGAAVDVPYSGDGGPTNSSGFTELPVPAGALQLSVGAEKYKTSTAQVQVGEGAAVSVEVTLEGPTSKP
jgi:Carboxypeptidase regulatory-like domain